MIFLHARPRRGVTSAAGRRPVTIFKNWVGELSREAETIWKKQINASHVSHASLSPRVPLPWVSNMVVVGAVFIYPLGHNSARGTSPSVSLATERVPSCVLSGTVPPSVELLRCRCLFRGPVPASASISIASSGREGATDRGAASSGLGTVSTT